MAKSIALAADASRLSSSITSVRSGMRRHPATCELVRRDFCRENERHLARSENAWWHQAIFELGRGEYIENNARADVKSVG
jgi:hypothetical protein